MKPLICWASSRELTDMVEIDRMSYQDPWSADDFRRSTMTYNSGGLQQVAMVANAGTDDNPNIVGYMVYSMGPPCISVSRFAVAPIARRTGVGRSMVERLKTKLHDGTIRIGFIIWERNLTAQLFLKACGFHGETTWGLRGWYENGKDDGYLFSYYVGKEVLKQEQEKGLAARVATRKIR